MGKRIRIKKTEDETIFNMYKGTSEENEPIKNLLIAIAAKALMDLRDLSRDGKSVVKSKNHFYSIMEIKDFLTNPEIYAEHFDWEYLLKEAMRCL